MIPIPVRPTVCGEFAAESVTVRLPERAPAALGVNTTDTVQLPFAARLFPHVFAATAKSPPAVVEMPLIVRAAELGFDMVTTCAALGTFTFCEPKLSACVMTGSGRIPVPLKVVVCGVLDPESAKFSVAERAPATVGVNVRDTTQ